MIILSTPLDLSSLGPPHSEVWVLLMAEGQDVLEWREWEVSVFKGKKRKENQVKKEACSLGSQGIHSP